MGAEDGGFRFLRRKVPHLARNIAHDKGGVLGLGLRHIHCGQFQLVEVRAVVAPYGRKRDAACAKREHDGDVLRHVGGPVAGRREFDFLRFADFALDLPSP